MKLLLNKEFLRRLALAAGLILSIVMYANSVGKVYKLDRPDFEKMLKADHKKSQQRLDYVRKTVTRRPHTISKQLLAQLKKQDLSPKSVPKLSLEQYIAKCTKNNSVPVSGPEWLEFIRNFEAHEKGRTPEEWADNKSTSSRSKALYFPVGQEPFAGVASAKHLEIFLVYSEGGTTKYIRMYTQDATRARYAQEALLYPWRAWFWLPFPLGLLLYLFIIPKAKRPQGALGYSRLWGVMISDFFSLILGGLCFLFAFFLIAHNNVSVTNLFSLDPGPLSFILIVMFFGLLLFLGMWFGISYRNFWINQLHLGLERHTWKGAVLYQYADMKQASLRIKEQSWLVRLILVLGSFDAGTMGMNATLLGKSSVSVVIEMKDGRIWRIALREPDLGFGVAKVLKENGVALDPKLKSFLEAGQEVSQEKDRKAGQA